MSTSVLDSNELDLSFAGLKAHYQAGDFTPRECIYFLHQQSLALNQDNPIYIQLLSLDTLDSYLSYLDDKDPNQLPLYGVPFAIKDNIDLARIATTAGCAEYAYTPEDSAFVVQQLIKAGAIPMGKTNLDQFATGLVGTRSPWGAVKNGFNPDYISGGSSAGSAVAVALGLVSFALGTDTAGSGRVPAALNKAGPAALRKCSGLRRWGFKNGIWGSEKPGIARGAFGGAVICYEPLVKREFGF